MNASSSARRQTSPAKAKRQRPKSQLRVIDTKKLRNEARIRRLVMVGMLVFAGALFLVAMVQARLIQTQNTLDQTRAETAALDSQIAILERDVMAASSPVAIVEAAEDLGMVRAQDPLYLVAEQRSAE